MSNMSYCMFENTSNDLYDCVERLQNGDDILEDAHSSEVRGLESLLEYAQEVVRMSDDIEYYVSKARKADSND